MSDVLKKGIDVSSHNGVIDWNKVKASGIDFAMIRGGFGSNSSQKDTRFDYNVKNAIAAGIDVGVYWFSYAFTPDDAVREAKLCLETIKPYEITYPVAFDFEYDSVRYGTEKGIKYTPELVCKIGSAFMSAIEEAGYYAINYTNPDYISKYFGAITDRYDLWCASWTKTKPSRKMGIWQYEVRGTAADIAARPQRATVVGSVPGINGCIDMDYAYIDYPALLRSAGLNKLAKVDSTTDYATLVCQKCGLEQQTKDYLNAYKWSADLWRKLYLQMK